MPIYTKTGDDGTTSLFRGTRISKSDLQVEAYGTIDELSSFIGLLKVKIKTQSDQKKLIRIQKDLYQIMGQLSGANADLKHLENRVKEFEQIIDKLQSQLPDLNRFILPGGSELSVLFQILRAVCRRGERVVVRYRGASKKGTDINYQIVLKYLNRLSDLFFIFARFYNRGNEELT